MADQYKLLIDLGWRSKPDGEIDVEAKVGEVRDDIPKGSVKWLLEQGHIEKVASSK